MLSVKQKSTTAAPAKTVSQSASSTASAQAAAVFSAHLKKNQMEQAARAAKHNRRDNVIRPTAANEPPMDAATLNNRIDDVDDYDGDAQHQQRDQQQQNNSQGQDGQSQDGGLPIEQRLVMLDRMDELAAESLAEQLADLSEDDGLFDIVHADGSTLSVALTRSAARLSLLLSTASAPLQQQLQRCKMELEARLARRIGKDVVVAVL